MTGHLTVVFLLQTCWDSEWNDMGEDFVSFSKLKEAVAAKRRMEEYSRKSYELRIVKRTSVTLDEVCK
jgi:hypothetical protein